MPNSSRQEKLDRINGEKYPQFSGRVSVSSILFQFNSQKYAKETYLPNLKGNAKYKIAGRIMARRDHKENLFFDLVDQTGTIQLHVKNNDSEQPNPQQEAFAAALDADLGDMVGVEGTVTKGIRSGEPLLLVSNWTLLAKALIEPADKFHGLKDPEQKYRHRERDLLSSAETRDLFRTRAEIVFEIRKYLNDRDFIEIECPVLQPIYGGATARPFKTRHNALGQDFFLSISSELYLKRAMVGGFDRVYSFSRCFRNEGISPTHNPEFTNLEIFESCKTSDDMKVFTEDLIEHAAHSVGSLVPTDKKFDNQLYSSDWPLSRKWKSEFPKVDKRDYADAWELFINNMEIASGASDLNDPREQEFRLKESESNKNIKDLDKIPPDPIEYDPYDKNYIEALEQGALPWAGVGIGIDRLVMLLTGKTNIRDVVLFPLLKDEK